MSNSILVKAAVFLGANTMLAMAAGDMSIPPSSSQVNDATARVWFEYAERFKNAKTSFTEHCAACFFRGVGLGIINVKSVLSTSEIDRLRAEIARLEEQVLAKGVKLKELQDVLDNYKQLVEKYGTTIATRETLTKGAVEAVSSATEEERILATTLEQCDEIVAKMVSEFESMNNKKLLGQYAQLAASCQQEKEKIEELTRELEYIQKRYPDVMKKFEEDSAKLGHIKARSMGSLHDLTQAAAVISSLQQQRRGSYVGTSKSILSTKVSS